MQNSGYYLDLNRFTLEELKELLKSSRLLPSQQILLDDIDERFAVLKGMGIESLAQLQKALKTKTAVTEEKCGCLRRGNRHARELSDRFAARGEQLPAEAD